MCGIFAYFGSSDKAAEIVLKGLKKLEYRGYDSWGIAYKTDDKIKIIKRVGKISDFDPKKEQKKKGAKSVTSRLCVHIWAHKIFLFF